MKQATSEININTNDGVVKVHLHNLRLGYKI